MDSTTRYECKTKPVMNIFFLDFRHVKMSHHKWTKTSILKVKKYIYIFKKGGTFRRKAL